MSPSSVPKNPPPLPAGMDNPWYDYAPFPKRPRLAWPRKCPRRLFRAAASRILGAGPRREQHPGPALCRRVRQLRAGLPDLDAARIRQSRRHLPRPRRARPLPDPRRRGGERPGRRALSLPHRAVQEAQVRVHRPRPFGQPHDHLQDDRGRGEGRDRGVALGHREGGRRASQGLGGPGQWRKPAHAPVAGRCRAGLRDRLAERRSALRPEGRQEVRLPAQPAGMGRRASSSGCAASPRRAIPISWARPSSCCTTKAGRSSTSRSIPG